MAGILYPLSLPGTTLGTSVPQVISYFQRSTKIFGKASAWRHTARQGTWTTSKWGASQQTYLEQFMTWVRDIMIGNFVFRDTRTEYDKFITGSKYSTPFSSRVQAENCILLLIWQIKKAEAKMGMGFNNKKKEGRWRNCASQGRITDHWIWE